MATVSDPKTVTIDVSPTLTAATLTSILATAPEDLTVAQLAQLQDAIARVPFGGRPGKTIGELLQ